MEQKMYTEIELVNVMEYFIEEVFKCKLLNSFISRKLDKCIYVSRYKEFTLHTIVFKNGIVKYNLLTNKTKYYTLTYKQVINEIKNIFTKM